LHLSDEEFWQLTFTEFDALCERFKVEQEREDWRAGLICAVLANIHRSKDTKPYKPQDFMPNGSTKDKEAQTPEQMAHLMMLYAAMTGGKIEVHEANDGRLNKEPNSTNIG
jgi:hypothetical protein